MALALSWYRVGDVTDVQHVRGRERGSLCALDCLPVRRWSIGVNLQTTPKTPESPIQTADSVYEIDHCTAFGPCRLCMQCLYIFEDEHHQSCVQTLPAFWLCCRTKKGRSWGLQAHCSKCLRSHSQHSPSTASTGAQTSLAYLFAVPLTSV